VRPPILIGRRVGFGLCRGGAPDTPVALSKRARLIPSRRAAPAPARVRHGRGIGVDRYPADLSSANGQQVGESQQ
jgi:hypothetical protein